MSSFSQYDLRVINKFVQTLKQKHGIQLEYRDPELAQKLCQIVSEKDDPELMMLWNSLSVELRAASIPRSKKPQEVITEKTRFYRGKQVKTTTAVNDDPKSSDEALSEEERIDGVNGHYITYRGKKTWVPKK